MLDFRPPPPFSGAWILDLQVTSKRLVRCAPQHGLAKSLQFPTLTPSQLQFCISVDIHHLFWMLTLYDLGAAL